MIEPNILAFQNAALLEVLNANQAMTLQGLADRIGRDNSNTLKTLKRLTAEGLLHANPLSTGLTDEGRAQLAAFKRAVHGGDARKPKGRWPLDKFRADPKNRPIDDDDVRGLADAVEERGDVRQPVEATAPDDEGIRTIRAGHRRWRSALLLQAEDRLPDALVQGLPFVEVASDEATAAVVAAIENGSRRDLTPWQDALALKRVADALGIQSPTEVARRLGRSREQDRGGVRDVQAKLKAAREATPEAIAAYEADPEAPGAWDILRTSVSKPKPKPEPEIVLIKAQRLALAELLHKAGGVVGKAVPILPAGHAAEGARLEQYGLARLIRSDSGDQALVTGAGYDYAKGESLTGDLPGIREQMGIPPRHGHAAYTTAWLNTPATSAQARSASAPEVRALAGIEPVGADTIPMAGFEPKPQMFSEAVIAAAMEEARKDPRNGVIRCTSLSGTTTIEGETWPSNTEPTEEIHTDWKGYPEARIRLTKSSHDRWHFSLDTTKGGPTLGGEGDAFGVYTDAPVYVSRHEALRHAAGSIRKRIAECMTPRLQAWLEALVNPESDPAIVAGVRYPNASRAEEARLARGIKKARANHGSGAQRAPETIETPDDIEGAQEDADRADEAHDADAARLLAQVREFVKDDGVNQPFGGWAFRKHLISLGLTGPFVPSGAGGSDDPDETAVVWDAANIGFAVCDPNSERHADIAEAQAELVAYALNLACVSGPNVGPGLHVGWPSPPTDETPDQAIVRTGRMIERILSTHTTSVAGDEAIVAEIYAQFRAAVRTIETRIPKEETA